MPELPEVETIRRELSGKIIKQKIKEVETLAIKSVHNPSVFFTRQLAGNQFTKIDRRGKLLIFSLKIGNQKLLVHLKMTGQLVYRRGKQLIFGGHEISPNDLVVPNRFTRIVFHFSDKSALYFNDMRRFGFMKLVPDAEVEKLVGKSYGIDALSPEFTKEYLISALKKRSQATIKAALLNQKHLAGIGNIYADEVCFATGILPSRRVGSLSSAKTSEIHTAIKRVLKLAIKHGGTTFSSQVLTGHYLRSDGGKGNFTQYLKVFDRTGEKCLRCKKGIIKKTRVAGRGTHFCPQCQH